MNATSTKKSREQTRFCCCAVLFAAVFGLFALPLKAAAPKSIADATKGLRKIDGYFPLYWDENTGKMWLEIGKWNRPVLYVASLPAGLGSNDIGLDRGLIPEPHVVEFERVGPTVLMIQPNYQFRASSSNPMEKRAVRDSFATSVLWGFDVSAATEDRVLVDATKFFEHDFVGMATQIAKAHQGKFQVDPSRCAFYLDNTKAFPKNTEVEVTLTFTGNDPGHFVDEVTPVPEAITVREHHSFVELPNDGYQPRAYDPRAGYFPLVYRDYSASLGDDLDKRLIVRHHLVKKDPQAARSEPVQPIVYYVDGGAPEDVRQALVEGASWWNEAFEAAGFENAFQVKVLPPDVDSMDVRYNVIQWVHRYTRGWSYGNSVADPRTGEILKGIVTLGSLRYRQDYLIFSSLLSPFGSSPSGIPEMKQAIYARLRQLAAHEVGHTLGLAHNYVASTDNNASVMDYPFPYVGLTEGGVPDLSHAYAKGIGAWDKVSIRYGYTQFAPGTDEHKALDNIIMDAAHQGHIFITDQDSRPLGSPHPKAHLWDNGPNAPDELARLLKVRAAALQRFGENSIPEGQPWSKLDETLVPLYYLHRYQTEATGKVLGGLDYTYALRGDGQMIAKIVPGNEQRRALKLLIQTMSPETLTLPERILKLIPPHPPGYKRTRESFPSQTGLTFDPIAGAEAAADLTASLLFNADRDERLVEYHARDRANPSFDELLNAVGTATFLASPPAGLSGEVKKAVDAVVFRRMLDLAADQKAAPLVQSYIRSYLQRSKLPGYLQQMYSQFEKNPKQFVVPEIPEPPPGQPIGEENCARPILPSERN